MVAVPRIAEGKPHAVQLHGQQVLQQMATQLDLADTLNSCAYN